jgi:hypothetical protein
LREVVLKLRQAWPHVTIVVRGNSGLATPEVYDCCEQQGLLYAFGYASNEVLKERTDLWLSNLQA